MIYRNEFTNKKAPETHSQMPVAGMQAVMPPMSMNLAGCGGIPPMSSGYASHSGMQSTPFIPGGYQNFTHNGNMTGTQTLGSSIPAVPAAGAVTTTSPAAPSVPSFHGAMPVQNGTPLGEQVPSTLQNTFFTPGFLRTQIGRRMRVEFLLGTNLLTDRTGTLVAVGASYIVLRLVDSDDLMMCDIYSIKFVTILL